ncbi:asparagine synthase (glutamine-hydrolyzing) [Pelagibacteraceae bacterium]|nr:asparagine synthase (glutamine-hydrolyzing) [Pelagibacteraceae bacterium]
MCGILGFVTNKIDNSYNKDLISNLTPLLHHRGPDQKNIYVSKNNKVYLGHTRLAIQDLSNNGSQPMFKKNSKYVISFNGEIYNHHNLRNELEKKYNCSWQSTCDTETLLECFERYGITKTLQKLDGMFSIILYDKEENFIHLIRDRYGEKPLYYGDINGNLVFSSELKVFKKFPKFNNPISYEAYDNYLKYNFIPAPLTIYEKVYKIKQGCFLTINLNINFDITNITHINWFDPVDLIDHKYAQELLKLSKYEILEKCGNLIDDSVNSRLISDVPVGVFLSGGIDSSLITYFARKNLNGRLKTFNISFENQNYNEGDIAQKTSRILETEHYKFEFNTKKLINISENISNTYDEPFADISQLPTIFLSHMTSKYVKVALSGDGGDEFFGGYKKYLWDKKFWKKLSWIKFNRRKLIGNAIQQNILQNNLITNLIPRKILQYLNQISKRLIIIKNNYDLYHSLISNLFVNAPISNYKFKSINHINRIYDERILKLNNFEQMMLYDILFTFSNGILCKLDRAAMQSSLETRLPFLNTNLNKFALNLPSNYKINKYNTKFLLKKLLSKTINTNHLNLNKMGFGIPISDWLRNEIKDWSKEIIFNGDKYNSFDNKFFRNAWDEHQKGYDHSAIIWNNIVYNLWSYS